MLTTNCFPEICELEVRIENDPINENELCCVTDFRICPGSITLGDDDCDISIVKVKIKVEIEGLQAVPKSRFGEPTKPNAVPITKRTMESSKNARSFQGHAEADLGTEGARAKIHASGHRESASEIETAKETLEPTNFLRVRALPSLQWEVSEQTNEPLSATYLNGDTLLKIVKSDKANRSSISMHISTRQRDILIKPEKAEAKTFAFFEQRDQNKKRLMDIFITKSLSHSLSWQDYRGEIKLSLHYRELDNDA